MKEEIVKIVTQRDIESWTKKLGETATRQKKVAKQEVLISGTARSKRF